MTTPPGRSTPDPDPREPVGTWTGTFIGSGPIVIFLASPVTPARGSASLVAGTAEGSIVNVPVEALPGFLLSHQSETFVSPDSAALSAAITTYPNPRQPEAAAVWACVGASRWLDLGQLDLLVGVADGCSVFKVRTEAELLANCPQKTGREAENRSSTALALDQNEPNRDRIHRVLGVYERLMVDLERMREDVERPSEPEYRQEPSPPLDRETELRREEFVRSCATRPELPLEPCQPGGRPEGTSAGGGSLFRGPITRGPIISLVLSASPDCFHGRVTQASIPDLREAAEKRFQFASGQLHQCLEARKSFHWSGEVVVRNEHGHLKTTKAIRGWLAAEARHLFDCQNQPASVPLNPEGDLTRNPEHWGTWAEWDRALWSWRELTRLAEILRFASAHEPAGPRYEFVPRLRSFDPNLDAYRRLGVPVLRPRPRHRLLGVRLRALRMQCLMALGFKRGYFDRGSSRLAGYFLGQADPSAAIAEELYAAAAVQDALNRRDRNTAEPHDDLIETDESGPDLSAIRESAAERFAALDEKHSRSPEAEAWQHQTEALVSAAILGVPDASLEVFLQCECRVPGITKEEALRLLRLLADDIVPELGICRTDRTTDIVCARRGQSAQQELGQRVAAAYPMTLAGRLRNELKRPGGGATGIPSAAMPPPPEGTTTPTSTAVDGGAGYLVRGRSLGGRFTAWGTHPVVLQHEVLSSEDDVRLEIAFALLAGGYRLIGIAGEEFVLEAPERDIDPEKDVDPELDSVADLARTAAARLLGPLAGHVTVKPLTCW